MTSLEENKVALEWIERFEEIIDIENKVSTNQESLFLNLKSTINIMKTHTQAAIKLNQKKE